MKSSVRRTFPVAHGWLPILAGVLLLAACSLPTRGTGGGDSAIPETGSIETAVQATPLPGTDSLPQSEPAIDPDQLGEAPILHCTSPATLTPFMVEGPYYIANSPERNSLLEEGMEGVRLILTGVVVDTDCQPVENAWLDFWQADTQGNYDTSGFTLRGHQYTDASGRYILETVFPGEYPGRTPHIHVRVRAPNGPELITQVFFPGEAGNEIDRIFANALVADMEQTGEELRAIFNFVVETE